MTDWPLSVLWYSSLLAIVVGLVGAVRPLFRLTLALPRVPIALVAGAVLVLALLIVLAPAARTVATPTTALDRVLPRYQFREIHSRSIDAPADRVRQAVRDVTASEIFLFQLFTTVRRFGRAAPESILNAPDDQPILDVAARSGFIVLADTEHESVLGTLVAAPPGLRRSADRPDASWFLALEGPGVAKAALNFVVESDGAGRTRLTTETRVFATDSRTARAFTAYWRTIFPGSWILRVTWLNAIAARAEAGST